MKISASKEKIISNIFVAYFLIGVVFAIVFALYYRWPIFALFSPRFFSVVFTWPFNLPGFLNDLIYFGLAGKPEIP